MVAKVESEAGADAALGFSYEVKIDDKRAVTLQSFLPNSCSQGELNALLDKMSNAADRQAAKHHIKALKRSLSMQTKQLRRVVEDLGRQDDLNQAAWKRANKKGDFRLSNEQEAHRSNVLVTRERFKEEIEDIQREIAETEALANGSDRGTTG